MARARKFVVALIASTLLPGGALAQSANQIVGAEKPQQEQPATEAAATRPRTVEPPPIVLPANAVMPPAPFVIKKPANVIAIPVSPATGIGVIKTEDTGKVEDAKAAEAVKSNEPPLPDGMTKPGVEVIRPPTMQATMQSRPAVETVARVQGGAEMRYEERPVIASTVKVGSTFGYRVDPFTGRAKFHSGLDIKAAWGDPVAASLSGVVKFAAWHSGYGNLLVIDHGGGVTTHYAHLSSFAAPIGARVTRGTIIGYAGSTGRSTSPHLHYEVRIDDNPVNPLSPLALDASSEFFLLHPTTAPVAPATPKVLSTSDTAGPSTTLQQKDK